MKNDHLHSRETPLAVGETAPDFTLQDQDRKEWKLSDAVKLGDVVLCFYPMAFTGVCGVEMKCVNDEMAAWTKKSAKVVGISCDSTAVQKAWADSMGLKQTLLADMHRHVCKAYGFYWADLNVSSRGRWSSARAAAGRARSRGASHVSPATQ